jgi:heat shock protein HtpX
MGTHGDDDGESSSPFAGLLMAIAAPLAASLIQLGISRSREYLADETGAAISGDPLALASALARLEEAATMVPSMAAQPATASLFIVNPFSGTGGLGLARLFSTHPSTADRVARLEAIAATRGAMAGTRRG